MNKDKHWLLREVRKLPYETEHGFTKIKLIDMFPLIHQLDEPEILSQEWIDNNVVHIRGLGDIFEAETVENLLVPKQELPVIPQFVADWIEKYIEYGYDLYPALKKMENNSRSWKKTYDWYRKNTRKFVNAYLTEGYEVEEEKKYYVDLDTAAYVAKWNVDNQVGIYTDAVFGSDEFEFHLTEKEIKDYDERYWPFAVEVEE